MAELKNIRIAVSGLYDYAFEELPTLRIPLPGRGAPEWVEEKRLYKVYRPAPVLAAACDKFKMLPLTHHHPKTPVDGQNFRELALGYTGENPWVDYLKDNDEVGIRSTLMMYDDEALRAYENGEVQLSPGYVAVFEWSKGTAPNGEEYDIIMKEITDVNHLALLPAGRGGEYAVVLDNAPEDSGEETVFDIVRKNHGNVSKDGAPKGNDNASKDHVKQEEEKSQYNESSEELKENYKKIQTLKPVSIDNNRNIIDQKEAEQIFRDLGEVTNKSDGHNADFAVQTVGKLLRHKGFDYGKVFESAGDLFANAQRVFSTGEEKKEGHKEHPNIKAYNNYVNKVSLNGKDYYIRFTTREEYPGRKNPNRKMTDNMHSCAVSEIALYETEKADSSTVSGSTPGGISNQPFIDSRLADFFKSVKQESVNDGISKEIILYTSDDLPKIKSIFDIVRNKKEVLNYGTVFDLVRVETEDVKYEDGHVSHRKDGDYVKQGNDWKRVEEAPQQNNKESSLSAKIETLEPIAVNPNWAYQPDDKTDLKDMVKNPIPFVGEGNDWKIGEAIENARQPDYKSNVAVDISSLKTLQPFVLKSGLENYKSWDNSERPYIVNYKGENYLIDGNHRVALAKLKGNKTINVDISVRE